MSSAAISSTLAGKRSVVDITCSRLSSYFPRRLVFHPSEPAKGA
jgi:hypothetical protein